MPVLKIETNLPADKIPSDFTKKATGIIATALGKPENYCVCMIIPNVSMSWGGTTDPCAIASLMSIGQLGVVENKKHSAIISKFVKDNLGIGSDRMYISFTNVPAADLGYKGTTFHEIFGGS